MPKIKVEIEYDGPEDPYWLNPDNVAIALGAYCTNTRFEVKWAEGGDPWREGAGERFCDSQGWVSPPDGWEKLLKDYPS